jgi:hypothetical protein
MSDFLNSVFSLDTIEKANLINLLQYTILSIIPIVLFNKLMQKYIPPADSKKSSVELIIEILLQLCTIVISMFFIDRIITFIPTYSEEPYATTYSNHWPMLGFIIIILSLQSNFGQKINILYDRAYNLFFTSEPESVETMDNDDEEKQQLPNTPNYLPPSTNQKILQAPQKVLSPKQEAVAAQPRMGEMEQQPSRPQPMQLGFLSPAVDDYEDNFY